MPPRTPRERPQSWKEVIDAMDRAEVFVTRAYQSVDPAQSADHLRHALRLMRRVLARAGRRPEHLLGR